MKVYTIKHLLFLLPVVLFLYLSGCVDSGYNPSYIISDKSHEEKMSRDKEAVESPLPF